MQRNQDENDDADEDISMSIVKDTDREDAPAAGSSPLLPPAV